MLDRSSLLFTRRNISEPFQPPQTDVKPHNPATPTLVSPKTSQLLRKPQQKTHMASTNFIQNKSQATFTHPLNTLQTLLSLNIPITQLNHTGPTSQIYLNIHIKRDKNSASKTGTNTRHTPRQTPTLTHHAHPPSQANTPLPATPRRTQIDHPALTTNPTQYRSSNIIACPTHKILAPNHTKIHTYLESPHTSAALNTAHTRSKLETYTDYNTLNADNQFEITPTNRQRTHTAERRQHANTNIRQSNPPLTLAYNSRSLHFTTILPPTTLSSSHISHLHISPYTPILPLTSFSLHTRRWPSLHRTSTSSPTRTHRITIAHRRLIQRLVDWPRLHQARLDATRPHRTRHFATIIHPHTAWTPTTRTSQHPHRLAQYTSVRLH